MLPLTTYHGSSVLVGSLASVDFIRVLKTELLVSSLFSLRYIFAERYVAHSADYAVARCLSVRTSVRLSVKHQHCVKTVKHIA